MKRKRAHGVLIVKEIAFLFLKLIKVRETTTLDMHWLKCSLVGISFGQQSPGLLRRQSESLSIDVAFGNILLAQVLGVVDHVDRD